METVQALRELGKRFRFISNNSGRSPREYSAMFHKMQLPVEEEDVVTPIVAILDYLKGIGFGRKLLVFGSRKLRSQFEEEGFSVLENGVTVSASRNLLCNFVYISSPTNFNNRLRS